MERVLVIIKHEAVKKCMAGSILTYFEEHGFTINTLYSMTMKSSEVVDFYNLYGSCPEDADLESMADKRNIVVFLDREDAHKFMNMRRPDKLLPIVYLKIMGGS